MMPPRPLHARPSLRWVALGASDATGAGLPDPERQSWVALLARSFRDTFAHANLGVGGALLADAREQQLPLALTFEPDVVSMWLVVNDAVAGVDLGAYREQLLATLGTLRAAGADVVVGNLPDLTLIPAIPLPPEERAEVRNEVVRWNDAIAAVVAQIGGHLVDFFANQPRHDDFCEDGFHPSARGHARIAEAFRPALHQIVQERLANGSVGSIGSATR